MSATTPVLRGRGSFAGSAAREVVPSSNGAAKNTSFAPALQGAHLALGSILSSVSCITCNKKVLGIVPAPLSLTACHFLLATFAGALWRNCSTADPKCPRIVAAKVGALGASSIGVMNLSLGHNSVAFYQLTKVALIPVMVFLNYFVYGQTTSPAVCLSLAVLSTGLVMATVTDTDLGYRGFIVGVVGVAVTVLFQLSMEWSQKKLKLRGLQVQMETAPWQLATASLFALTVEVLPGAGAVSHSFDGAFLDQSTIPSLAFWLAGSCVSAQLANYYSYTIIGKFSAMTYQVVAHSKTVLVLACGLCFFADQATRDPLHIFGLGVTVVGIVSYSVLKLNA